MSKFDPAALAAIVMILVSAACGAEKVDCNEQLSDIANKIPLADTGAALESTQFKLRKLMAICAPIAERVQVMTMTADELGLLILANDHDRVDLALKRGADLRFAFEFDDFGTRDFAYYATPVHMAAMYGTQEMVSVLTTFGLNTNAGDIGGQPPLIYAVSNVHNPCEMGKALIAHGAKLDAIARTGEPSTVLEVLESEAPEFLNCIAGSNSVSQAD